MDLKDTMMYYGVTLCKRYTKKQKQFFLEMMMQHCKDNGLKADLLVKHAKMFQVASFVVGDLKKANTIVACAYDTPSKGMIPLKYYPFNSKKNADEETKSTIANFIIAGILFVLAYFVLKDFMASTIVMKVVRGLVAAVLAVECIFILTGIANSVNFSRNSAAVAVMSQLMDTVRNPSVAYVYLDQMVNSYEGLKVLKENISENKTIILLDGLAYGQQVVVAHRENMDVTNLLQEGWMDRTYDAETKNALQFFPKTIQISCGDIVDHQFYIPNVRSKKDMKIDMKRMETFVEVLTKYLKER